GAGRSRRVAYKHALGLLLGWAEGAVGLGAGLDGHPRQARWPCTAGGVGRAEPGHRGPAGRAAQRPEWAYLLGEADQATLTEPWDLAPVGRRIGHLSALRRRDPAAARDLLVGTWDTESAQERAALLGTLAL